MHYYFSYDFIILHFNFTLVWFSDAVAVVATIEEAVAAFQAESKAIFVLIPYRGSLRRLIFVVDPHSLCFKLVD